MTESFNQFANIVLYDCELPGPGNVWKRFKLNHYKITCTQIDRENKINNVGDLLRLRDEKLYNI